MCPVADRTSELTRQYVARQKARGPAAGPVDEVAEIRARWANPERFASKEVTPGRRDVETLLARVAMLEDCVLAGASLLFPPAEDWGPIPKGSKQSYLNYLTEGYYETAAEIRDREADRG